MALTRSAQAVTQRQSGAAQPAGQRSISLPRQAISPEQVDLALRSLPSHGWAFGWTGRRDRALLVLSQMAGLSFHAIAELTVADLAIADGVAVIRTPGGATTLRSNSDGRICGPCALARWVHALELTSIHSSPGVVTAVIARAAPVTAGSPHACQGVIDAGEDARARPLLPSVDQWGPLPATPQHSAGSIGRTPSLTRPAAPATPSVRPRLTRPFVATPGAADRMSSAPAGNGRIGVSVSESGADSVPAQRSKVGAPNFPMHLGLVRSNYSRVDRERTAGPATQLADRLEDRARALLDPRTS